jgi:hypothetical protein
MSAIGSVWHCKYEVLNTVCSCRWLSRVWFGKLKVESMCTAPQPYVSWFPQ